MVRITVAAGTGEPCEEGMTKVARGKTTQDWRGGEQNSSLVGEGVSGGGDGIASGDGGGVGSGNGGGVGSGDGDAEGYDSGDGDAVSA